MTIEVKNIRRNTKVSRKGAYRMPLEQYHSDCCKGPSISGSGLVTIENECPAQYWAFSIYNENRWASPDTVNLSFGRAAHCLLLGDEVFSQHYAIRPAEFRDWKTLESRAWRGAMTMKGLTVVTPQDLGHIGNMSEVLAAHPLVGAAGLLDGAIEVSLIWKDRETGIWLKVRPDVVPEFEGAVTDFKTAMDAKPLSCMRSITRYGYHMKAALVADGMREVLGREVDHFLLIFQQRTPPYTVMPVEISAEAIYWAGLQVRRAIRAFAHGLETGEWPGYGDEILTYHLPEGLAMALSEQFSDGEADGQEGGGEDGPGHGEDAAFGGDDP